ncbi:MAG: acyloxyacyl hydrolase [Candidatus Rokuibacteriota bacterium]
MRSCLALLCLGLFAPLFAPSPSQAEDLRWLSVGIRGGANGQRVLGGDEPESFRQYDVVTTLGLPLSWYAESGWGVGTRLMASVGALTGGGDTAFLATLVPGIALGRRDSALAMDIGIGGALLSRYELGRQDFGGPFQVVFTFGLTVPIYGQFGLGYRLHHISDAGLYDNGLGGDLHMLELTYRFR